MVMLAKAIPQIGRPERNFATLGEAERVKLGVVLRPLPWIDGLITALLVSPADEEPEGWSEHIWVEDELGRLTLAQSGEVSAVVDDQFGHIAGMLFENPQGYQPFLGTGDRLEAAAQWAAGFRFGIRLQPEPWEPLICDDDTPMLLAVIFSMERDEDLAEETGADSLRSATFRPTAGRKCDARRSTSCRTWFAPCTTSRSV